VPRCFFDVRTNHGVIERDATGVLVPHVGVALHGCIGAVLELLTDAADVDALSLRYENGETLMRFDLQALRAALLETP
jgi:hypothetical protein